MQKFLDCYNKQTNSGNNSSYQFNNITDFSNAQAVKNEQKSSNNDENECQNCNPCFLEEIHVLPPFIFIFSDYIKFLLLADQDVINVLFADKILVIDERIYNLDEKTQDSKMIDYSYKTLKAKGYYPYYMYRQSKSLGNLENVGWCKDGFDCLYNVFMMDETHSVFAVGAGAVTKLKDPATQHIERVYNYKYPRFPDLHMLLYKKKI